MADAILDPFHRELAAAIVDQIEAEKNALSTGSAKRTTDGTETVAERYADMVGYIRGLMAALDVAAQVERRQMSAGTRPGQTQYE